LDSVLLRAVTRVEAGEEAEAGGGLAGTSGVEPAGANSFLSSFPPEGRYIGT